MPKKLDIMHAIRKGLDDAFAHSSDFPGWTTWTKDVLSKVCEVGQNQFGCYVCANTPKAECSEWLYDMTWLEYTSHTVGKAQTSGGLIGAHLVVECEWSSRHKSIGEIEDDFSKLLLARAGVRLMVCYDWRDLWHHDEIKDAEGLAKFLAEQVQLFNGTQSEDCYLLAILCWDVEIGAYRFKHFELGLNGAIAWI